MMKVYQFVKIIDFEGKLKSGLNLFLITVFQFRTIRNYKTN